ncbi:MAG: antitermination protein NusB [Oscillospiraceae bacterium]|nr:antitermination protein NusB [Oscillospiraceae bacterium]
MAEKRTKTQQRREQLFTLVFQLPYLDYEAEDLPKDTYSAAVLSALKEHLADIDARIESHLAPGWKLFRLAKPTLAVLRLGVCELEYMDKIPTGATINEMVNLAKRYGDDGNCPRFVNGVLGAIAREKAE